MRKSIALFLSFVMLLSVGGAAGADDDAVNVVITDEGNEVSVTIDGEPVEQPPTGETITGVETIAYEDQDGQSTIKVSVNDMTAIENKSSVIAEVKDDVTASGVGVISVGETKATIQANQNVAAAGEVQATGARVTAKNGGSATARIGGDLTATATDGPAVGASVQANDGGMAALTVGGSIIPLGNETQGLNASADGEDSTVGIVVLGDVVGGITAIDAHTDNGGVITADVYGDVNSGGTGIDADSKNGGELHVYAADYVSGERGTGVHVESEGMDSWASVIVETDISSGTAAGIFAEGSNGGGANASAGGTVTGEVGILVDNDDGRVSIDVVNLDTGVTTNLEGTHNVAASEAGIEIRKSHAEDNDDTQTTVAIDGVLSVEEGGTPILLGEAVTETDVATINITVWKIEGQSNDAIVSGGEGAAAAALQKSINYIIKIADNEDSQTVFGGQYQNGDVLTEGEHEIMLTVPEGFEITSAYATDGSEVPITKGSDGRYYAVIPAGGGILLNATLGKTDWINHYDSYSSGTASMSPLGASIAGGLRLTSDGYMLTLTPVAHTMTFVRSTLERFAKLNDAFFISTPNGSCEVSLSAILNYDEKAVNFRFDLTDGAVEIYANGALIQQVSPK